MMQNELSGMRVFAWLGVMAGSMLGLARQPPGIEVWRLVDGTWCYQETVKDERRWQVN